MKRVAIVTLGRDSARGERRRVASWRMLFEAAGAEVEQIRLFPNRRPHLDGVRAVVAGNAPPERLAWSGTQLRVQLQDLEPAVVLAITSRAFDPGSVAGNWTLALDLVDSLSRSYRDRSEIVDGSLRRWGYRSLAAAHHRVEMRLAAKHLRLIAAGVADAKRLGAEWVPILVEPSAQSLRTRSADRDVLFFGTLGYPPNIDALERLSRLWPEVLRRRPGTTALVAGAAPPARVRELCRVHGWELHPDFAAVSQTAARARIAVAPHSRTAGMQIKVLEAACLGLPQVVTPAVLEGYDAGFPLRPQFDDSSFAAEIVRLLDNPLAAAALAAEATRHVLAHYTTDRWRPWACDVLSSAAPAHSTGVRRTAAVL